jgi:hypothetical protein
MVVVDSGGELCDIEGCDCIACRDIVCSVDVQTTMANEENPEVSKSHADKTAERDEYAQYLLQQCVSECLGQQQPKPYNSQQLNKIYKKARKVAHGSPRVPITGYCIEKDVLSSRKINPSQTGKTDLDPTWTNCDPASLTLLD